MVARIAKAMPLVSNRVPIELIAYQIISLRMMPKQPHNNALISSQADAREGANTYAIKQKAHPSKLVSWSVNRPMSWKILIHPGLFNIIKK